MEGKCVLQLVWSTGLGFPAADVGRGEGSVREGRFEELGSSNRGEWVESVRSPLVSEQGSCLVSLRGRQVVSCRACKHLVSVSSASRSLGGEPADLEVYEKGGFSGGVDC